MRTLTSQRVVNVVAVLLVSVAAASTPLSYLLKPSAFRIKSDRIAHLHQLQAGTVFQGSAASAKGGLPATPLSDPSTYRAPYQDAVASAR